MRRSESETIESTLEAEPQEAVAMIEALIGAGDRDPDLRAYLAEALEAAGDRQGAIAAWTTYMEIDPQWPGAYCRRAELLVDAGRFDAAQAELLMATSMFDDEPRLVRSQAILNELRGDHEGADRGYLEAADRDYTLPAPPRLDRAAASRALLRAAGRGATVVVKEVPDSPGEEGFFRPVDLNEGVEITVYLRNLERELESEATIDDLLEVFQIACLRAREQPAGQETYGR